MEKAVLVLLGRFGVPRSGGCISMGVFLEKHARIPVYRFLERGSWCNIHFFHWIYSCTVIKFSQCLCEAFCGILVCGLEFEEFL
jgi:hypothetical protein